MHFLDHADSEYLLHVWVDGKGAEFIGNKQIHLHTHTHTHTQLYI